MASVWSCPHVEGLAVVRSLGPVGFYRWWPDGGAGYAAWLLPGGATQGRPAHPHASPWHGQAPHALTQWNAPASLVSPPFLTLTRALCRHRSAQGRGQRAVRSWLGVTHRVASPGTATAGGLQVGAGCAGWSGIYVLTSVWCGLVGVWWLSDGAALTRCGWAVVTPFTGGAWPVQVGSPKFFWPRW